jgi:hypothetical protein
MDNWATADRIANAVKAFLTIAKMYHTRIGREPGGSGALRPYTLGRFALHFWCSNRSKVKSTATEGQVRKVASGGCAT